MKLTETCVRAYTVTQWAHGIPAFAAPEQGAVWMSYDISDQPISAVGVAPTGAFNSAYAYDGNLKRVSTFSEGSYSGAKPHEFIFNVYDSSGVISYADKHEFAACDPNDLGCIKT